MLARPIPRRGFILGGITVMAGAKISTALGVLVLSEIGIVPMPVGDLLDLVPFLPEDNKLLLAPFRGGLGFIEPRKSLAVVFDSTRRQAFESLSSHPPSAFLRPP